MKLLNLILILSFFSSSTAFASRYGLDYNQRIKSGSDDKRFYSREDKFHSDGGAISNFAKKTTINKKNKNIESPINRDYSRTKRAKDSTINDPIIKDRKYKEFDTAIATNIYADLNTIYRNGRYVGYYKVGNPYKIDDLYYYPQEYEHYEEIGMASWYGEDFDGKLTANGEIYDLSLMTAAHRTLPMPSIVKVTNLTNKRSVLVRVNDRGPFAKNRIIDLSKKAAQILDYKDRGTIMVKVELDNEKTRELQDRLKINPNKDD